MMPYYQDEHVTLYHADARGVAELAADCRVTIADPPYAETALPWDQWPKGWPTLMPGMALWVYGSLRVFLERGTEIRDGGWTYSQDLVWEKQNGTGFAADRFRRVHELAAFFYRGPWSKVYRNPVLRHDAAARVVHRSVSPTHTSPIGASRYATTAGGARYERSVVRIRNCHRTAVHPTEKPVALARLLIQYACAPGSTLFVPFAGSGAELVAAKQLGLRAIGCDTQIAYCEAAASRLASLLPFDATIEE